MTNPFTSAAKIAANIANSQKSTGPKSDEGKAKVSQNARKHGLASATLYIPEALQPLFDEIDEDLRLAIKPSGTLEEDFFAQFRNARFNMERIQILLAQLGRESEAAGKDPLLDSEIQKQWDRLDRYYSRAQSAFSRNLKELRKLQTDRAVRQQAVSEDSNFPGLADPRPALNILRQTVKSRQQQAASSLDAFINGPLGFSGGSNPDRQEAA